MFTRRFALAAVVAVLVPLAACSAAPPPGPAASAAPAASPAGSPAAAPASAKAPETLPPVVVFAPGALAAHTKALTAAYAEAGGEVSFEVGHTPMQREQLAKGAAPDVWIAANPADMTSAVEAGLVDSDGLKPLGRTKLVVVVAPDNPGAITEFADLAQPGKKLLLGAMSIPIGMATDKMLTKAEADAGAGFKEKVEANIASRELGVMPIVNKVQLGEADAGIVFVTDVPADPKGLTTIEVPEAANTFLTLSIAPVTAGKEKAGATAFIDYVTTGAGKDLLAQVGYLPPAE